MAIRKPAILAACSVLAASLTGCGPVRENVDTGLPLVEADIGDIQAAIRSGRVNCRTVVAGYLARIETYDKPLGINAITVVNQHALAVADEIDARVVAGAELGPLFCAPLLIKDNFQTDDMETSGGSIAFAGFVPPRDAFMVRKLREADAIILAKTNMAEWAFSPRHTNSSSHGETANAYDSSRTPAGSSGGTASGVAASFGVAGFGSDTGNSIRGPASHLALFGIRSTIGLTSRAGIIPLSFDRDIAGPLTRTVEDAARLFNVVAGYDPADPYTRLGRGKRESDYTAFLNVGGLRGARLGVLRDHVDTTDADPEVIAIFARAVADLRRAGAAIVDPFIIPNLAEYRDKELFCARFRYDMYVYTGSLGAPAPLRDVATLLETKQYTPYGKGSLEFFADSPLDVAPAEWEPPCPDFADNPLRQAFLDDTVSTMDALGVDAIIYPTWTNPPAPLATAVEDYQGDNSQLLAPATGMPAVTVPMGWWQDRLPAGLQMVGRPWSEGLLFRLAYAYEQATRHRRPPAGFPELE